MVKILGTGFWPSGQSLSGRLACCRPEFDLRQGRLLYIWLYSPVCFVVQLWPHNYVSLNPVNKNLNLNLSMLWCRYCAIKPLIFEMSLCVCVRFLFFFVCVCVFLQVCTWWWIPELCGHQVPCEVGATWSLAVHAILQQVRCLGFWWVLFCIVFLIPSLQRRSSLS
jgi:hypothetical protein